MAEPAWSARSLTERFPALRHLRLPARRRVPQIAQTAAVDCGAACIAMVLGYFGRREPLDEVRKVVGTDRDGTDAQALVEGGRHFGLRARAVSVEGDDFEFLPAASVLFWEFNHFVVFERLRGGAAEIVDPAAGRRRVPLERFQRSFTGVAVTFEPNDHFEPGGTKGRPPFWRYLRQLLESKALVSRVLVVSVLVQAFGLVLPLLTGMLVDRVVPRGDYSLLLVLAGGLSAIVLFNFLATLIRSYLLLHLRARLDAQLTLSFVEHLVSLPYGFFQLRSAGDLVMRMNSNARVREVLTSATLATALDGALVVAYLALLLALSVPIGLLALLLGMFRVGCFLAVRRRQRDLMTESLELQARASGYQVEMLTGMETLKAMGAERQAVDHWSNLFVDTLNVDIARGRLEAWFSALLATLGLASPLAVLVVGGYLVLEGQLSLGTMLALSALAAGFLSPLSGLVETAVQLQLLGSYFDRLEDVFSEEPEQQPDERRPAPRIRGGVKLERVSFRYGPRAPFVLTDVDFQIEPAMYVAIVGRSGAGKSTLARLILGLFPPTSGQVLYDGEELSAVDRTSMRRQLGIVTQHPQLFSGSIRDNIALGHPDLPLDRVVAAGRLASIHDEIMAMPMGYETVLADRGLSLSGGQRQRLALARALVHEPALLLLDEATSEVDTVTEACIQSSLAALRSTRIVIAHRLSTVVDADLIVVLEGGLIRESGSYNELVTAGGAFARLVHRQLPERKDHGERLAAAGQEHTEATGGLG